MYMNIYTFTVYAYFYTHRLWTVGSRARAHVREREMTSSTRLVTASMHPSTLTVPSGRRVRAQARVSERIVTAREPERESARARESAGAGAGARARERETSARAGHKNRESAQPQNTHTVTNTNEYTHTHTHVHAHTHARTHPCTHARTHARTHSQTQTPGRACASTMAWKRARTEAFKCRQTSS